MRGSHDLPFHVADAALDCSEIVHLKLLLLWLLLYPLNLIERLGNDFKLGVRRGCLEEVTLKILTRRQPYTAFGGKRFQAKGTTGTKAPRLHQPPV